MPEVVLLSVGSAVAEVEQDEITCALQTQGRKAVAEEGHEQLSSRT